MESTNLKHEYKLKSLLLTLANSSATTEITAFAISMFELCKTKKKFPGFIFSLYLLSQIEIENFFYLKQLEACLMIKFVNIIFV